MSFISIDYYKDKKIIKETKCEINTPDGKLDNGYYCGAVGFSEKSLKEFISENG